MFEKKKKKKRVNGVRRKIILKPEKATSTNLLLYPTNIKSIKDVISTLLSHV